MADKPKYEYRLCEIRDRGGDLDKRWYIEFWVWDVALAKLIRKVDYIPAKFKTLPQRYGEAQRLKKEIDAALIGGAFFDSSGKTVQSKKATVKTVHQGLEWFMSEHSGEVGERTREAYRSFFNVFSEFLRDTNLGKMPLTQLDAEHIYSFLTYLTKERKLQNRSRNNYLVWLNTVFHYLVERKVLEENPAKGIKKLKTVNSSHVPYTDEQAKTIKEYLRANNPQLFLLCAFIYYTLARPKEIQLLKIRDIKQNKILFNARVTVSGKEKDLTKNHKSEFVVIPEGLQKLISEFELKNHNSDFFIFGTDGEPGPVPHHRNRSNKRYKLVQEALGITGGQSLYSWKHTGAIKLYQATKDLKKVQRQCRHWSITETDNYIRDLGLFEDDEVEFNFPDF